MYRSFDRAHEGYRTKLPQRYEIALDAFKSTVAWLKDLYITMGTDDWTGIVEAPNEDAMMKALLTIAGIGMAKSQTMSVNIAKALDLTKGPVS